MSELNSTIDQLRQAFSKRYSQAFRVTGATNDFRIMLPQLINLNPNLDYEIALTRFDI